MKDITEFLGGSGPIIDVRSPGEFTQGHIPGAINAPLFSDAERAEVGTVYKQEGPDAAMYLGLRFFGPRIADFWKSLRQSDPVRVHCWRGGMRSQSVAGFLKMTGTPSSTLKGGYKSYRRWALGCLEQPGNIVVLGGFTGCGKTQILQALRDRGEQVIDLEAIAKHRGSAYGNLPGMPQPSTEQFENELAFQWAQVDRTKPVWIEDESRLIGTCAIPNSFFSQMQEAPLIVIERSIEERLEILSEVYRELSDEQLRASTERIRKRLGGERTDEILRLGEAGDFDAAVKISLGYYDKAYRHSLAKRKQPTVSLQAKSLTDQQWADHVLTHLREAEKCSSRQLVKPSR